MKEYIIYVLLIFLPIGAIMAYFLRKEGLGKRNTAITLAFSLLIIITFPIMLVRLGLITSFLSCLLLIVVITRYLLAGEENLVSQTKGRLVTGRELEKLMETIETKWDQDLSHLRVEDLENTEWNPLINTWPDGMPEAAALSEPPAMEEEISEIAALEPNGDRNGELAGEAALPAEGKEIGEEAEIPDAGSAIKEMITPEIEAAHIAEEDSGKQEEGLQESGPEQYAGEAPDDEAEESEIISEQMDADIKIEAEEKAEIQEAEAPEAEEIEAGSEAGEKVKEFEVEQGAEAGEIFAALENIVAEESMIISEIKAGENEEEVSPDIIAGEAEEIGEQADEDVILEDIEKQADKNIDDLALKGESIPVGAPDEEIFEAEEPALIEEMPIDLYQETKPAQVEEDAFMADNSDARIFALIEQGFLHKEAANLREAAACFELAWDISFDDELKRNLAIELLNIYQLISDDRRYQG